jgi:hypothetical protein
MEQNQKQQIEQGLAQALTDGEMKKRDPAAQAVEKLSPRYEIRTQAERDPIVEETKIIRGIVREADDRYDAYMDAAEQANRQREDGR